MRAFTLLILCCALFSFKMTGPKKGEKKISVSGIITSTSSYCGGASPTDEMLAELATPVPVTNKKIYIKKGEINSFEAKIVLELKVDTNGKFHAMLPPGKYLVVDEDKKDLTYYNTLLKEHKDQTENYYAVDSICLREWYRKPDFTFEVKNTPLKNIHVNYHRVCFDLPCTQFRGPFPP